MILTEREKHEHEYLLFFFFFAVCIVSAFFDRNSIERNNLQTARDRIGSQVRYIYYFYNFRLCTSIIRELHTYIIQRSMNYIAALTNKKYAILINTSMRFVSGYRCFRAYLAKILQKSGHMQISRSCYTQRHALFPNAVRRLFVSLVIVLHEKNKRERETERVNCCGRVPK